MWAIFRCVTDFLLTFLTFDQCHNFFPYVYMRKKSLSGVIYFQKVINTWLLVSFLD